ncbi:hypothetical protein CGRA01v4_12479 [Colletotrichum graminicola]|nr:hypothetical protein CGRA01v4_12479 [Colletotrichum graminicola]
MWLAMIIAAVESLLFLLFFLYQSIGESLEAFSFNHIGSSRHTIRVASAIASSTLVSSSGVLSFGLVTIFVFSFAFTHARCRKGHLNGAMLVTM